MNKELLVPTGLVHEKLGITGAPKRMRLGGTKLDIRRLNIMDADSPARGYWIDRDATLKFLEARNREMGGNAMLEKVINELRAVTAGAG